VILMPTSIVAGDWDCWKGRRSGLCVLSSLFPGVPRVSDCFSRSDSTETQARIYSTYALLHRPVIFFCS
jgi:hypothetical protein